MNISVTKWNLLGISSLEQASILLKENKVQEVHIDWDDDPLKNKFTSVNEFEINNILLENKIYRNIMFKATVERSRSKRNWFKEDGELKERTERTFEKEADFILYENENGISMISIGAATTVEKVINYGFDSNLWGNISKYSFNIEEDTFYWLLDRLRNNESNNLSENGDIKITGLLSYLGKTSDGNNAIRANGRRVLSILGTLAYIFSSETIKSVRPEFQYNGQIFVLELTLNNTFRIYEDNSMGIYNTYVGNEKIIAISIYVLETIVPRIIHCYKNESLSGIWSATKKKLFLKSIGEELMQDINYRLHSIESEVDNRQPECIEIGDKICLEIEEDLLEEDMLV